mmetsp:Transcript_24581/g.50762  ORF Transcript_24581/g.50762 Transcript_24581/m.50762 type:complete len:102 (-) Transcript_24581:2-307(-)
MVSIVKKILEAQKSRALKRRRRSDNTNNNNNNKTTKTMASKPTVVAFRIVLCLFFAAAIVSPAFAPPKGPKLPEGFCEHGDVTATTGECMCHWQHKVRLLL